MNGKCILCYGDFYDKPLMALSDMPSSAQNIPAQEELKNDSGITLELHQCKCCGLVQFDCEPVDYYKKVIRAGGGSSTMHNLRKNQYTEFINKFALEGKKIIEIGCGQGEFLSIFDEFNVHAAGIEYSPELVKMGKAKGLTIYQSFIDDKNTVIPNGLYNAFVQFNFLEHQPYPNEMLQGIYNNLTDDGVGLITVPSLEYIVQNGYYELIRDHIAYYSKESLFFLFEKNGFDIIDHSIINRDTHSILVRKRKPIDTSAWDTTFRTLKRELHDYIDRKINDGKRVAVWGASHQGFTILSTLHLSGKISYIIDSAQFKQGRFSPASQIPIVSPDYFYQNPVDAIIIMAPGYTDEIAGVIKNKMSNEVETSTIRTNNLELLS